MHNFTLFLFLILLIFNVNSLTKEEFISQLKQTAGFKKITLQLQTAEQQKILADSKENWLLQANLAHKKNTNQNNLLNQNKPKNSNILTSTISRPIFKTGGNLAISYNWSYNDMNNINNYHDNGWKVLYSHPLLRNASGIIDKSDSDLAEIDKQIAHLQIIEQQQQYINNKLKLFINWAKYQKQLEYSIMQLDLANQLLSKTMQKYKNSMVDEVDVITHKELVFTREQAILTIKQQLFSIKEQIAKLLNNNDIINQYTEFNLEQKYTTELNKDIEQTALFKALKLTIKQLERKIKTLVNNKKPLLNINSSITNQGQHSSYDKSLFNTSTEYSIGINYQQPLNNSASSASLIQAKILKDEKNLNYQELLNNKIAEINNLKQNLISLEKHFMLSAKRLKNAKEKTKKQQNRYQYAEIDINLVVDALNDEQRIEIEKLNYQQQYHNTYYDYLAIFNLIK